MGTRQLKFHVSFHSFLVIVIIVTLIIIITIVVITLSYLERIK